MWIGGALAPRLVFLAFRVLARRATTRDQTPDRAPGPILPLAISPLAIAA